MRPAAGQLNASLPAGREGGIRAVAITLDDSPKIDGDDFLQASRGPAGFPSKNHVSPGSRTDPQISLAGLAVTRFQVFHRSLIDLDVSAGHDPGSNLLIDRPQPFGRHSHPSGQGLPGQMNTMPTAEDLFLPVKGQMIAVFADDQMGQKTRSRHPSFQKLLSLSGDRGWLIDFRGVDIAAANQ